MMEKLSNLIMLIAASAWLAWIVVGGNAGDVELTTRGTTLAMAVSGAAFCIKMAVRWIHGNY